MKCVNGKETAALELERGTEQPTEAADAARGNEKSAKKRGAVFSDEQKTAVGEADRAPGDGKRVSKTEKQAAENGKRAVICEEKAVICEEKAVICEEKAVNCEEKAVNGKEKAVNCEEKAVNGKEKAVNGKEKAAKSGAKSGAKSTKTRKKAAKSSDNSTKTPRNSAKNGEKTSKTGRNTAKKGDAAAASSEKAAGSTARASEKGVKSPEDIAKVSENDLQIAGEGERPRRTKPFKRRRYDDAAVFCDAVEGYFDSISYEEQAREIIGVNKLGEYIWGEGLFSVRGDPIILVKYAEPPSVEALCLYIGMPRSTWYAKQEDEGFAPIIEDALMRIDAYRRQVTIEDSKRSRGAQFLIQRSEAAAEARAQRKAEAEAQAQAAAAGGKVELSTEEKLRALEDLCKLARGEAVDLAAYTVADDEDEA